MTNFVTHESENTSTKELLSNPHADFTFNFYRLVL